MASPILGIDYSKDTIRIVEVSYGRRLKVHNFASIETAAVPAERRSEQLLHTLETRGFQARQAVVAFSGPGVDHKLLQLPPLSSRELEFVIAREARKSSVAKDLAWSYEILETQDQVGIQKDHVLLATSDAETVKGVRDAFAGSRFKVVQVTTAAEALVNVLRNTAVRKKDAVRCVVHLSGTRGHVVFVRGSHLLLARDIQFDYYELAQDEQTARLLTELKRSNLFFKQNFPQSNIEEIFFSGDSKLLGAAANAVKEELGIESSLLRVEDLLDVGGLRGDWDALRFNLPALSVALGAGWRKDPGAGINFLPDSKPAARKGAGARLARILVPAGVALVLAGGGYYYAAKSRTEPRLADLQQRKSQLEGLLMRAEEHRQLQEREAAIARITAPVELTEVLRELSLVVPQTAVFESVRFEKQDKRVLIIRGSIVGNLSRVATDFNSFVGNLRKLPGITNVKANNPPSENDGGQSRIHFEVQCDLI